MNQKQKDKATDITKLVQTMLRIWIVEKDKEKAYELFMEQNPQTRYIVVEAMRKVVSISESAEFREAAKDIPEYIKSKL